MHETGFPRLRRTRVLRRPSGRRSILPGRHQPLGGSALGLQQRHGETPGYVRIRLSRCVDIDRVVADVGRSEVPAVQWDIGRGGLR